MYSSLFPCFSKKLALELRKNGFNIVKTAPNTKFPEYDVYYFIESYELRQFVAQYSSKK